MKSNIDVPVVSSIKLTKGNKILKTQRSKKIFNEKANQLLHIGILTELDIEQLAIYAYSLDELFVCIDEIKNVGRFKEIYDENGHVLRFIENPYMKRYREMFEIVNKIASDFGFTPVSRMKFRELGKPNEKPRIEDLLK